MNATLSTKPVSDEQRRGTHKHYDHSRNIKSILLPCHGILDWRNISWKLCVCSGSKQVHMRTTIHLTVGTKHLLTEGSLDAKDLSARMFFFPKMHLVDKVTQYNSLFIAVVL